MLFPLSRSPPTATLFPYTTLFRSFSPENKEANVATFVQKFKARWNNETPDAFAALGYDAAYVLVDAIKRAGTTEGPKDRKSTRLNSSHLVISYAVFCFKNKEELKS